MGAEYMGTSTALTTTMGRVRTKTVKRSARFIVEKYYPRLTLDFDTNKRITDEVAVVPSKRMRNKIAGYVTHLMRRMQKGPVRGISIKLQEEERERCDNYVPEVSVIEQDVINIDADTKDMLKAMDFGSLPGIHVVSLHSTYNRDNNNRFGGNRVTKFQQTDATRLKTKK